MTDILLIVAGYLLGSVSSAIVICRIMGLPDPRGEGSGNPGTTNVLRLGGRKAALLTLAGDMLKGLVPVLVAKALHATPEIQAATALAAFLGHLYPVFFGFQGGKGVATALGVFLGLHWLTGLIVTAIWIIVALLFRISSLSGLIAMLLAPLVFWYLQAEMAYVYVTMLIAVMLFWRHRSNIRNLLTGKEDKIELSSSKEQK